MITDFVKGRLSAFLGTIVWIAVMFGAIWLSTWIASDFYKTTTRDVILAIVVISAVASNYQMWLLSKCVGLFYWLLGKLF